MRKQLIYIIATAVIALCAAMPAVAGKNLAIIEGADPVGAHVNLSVANTSRETRTGTVQVAVILADGTRAFASYEITVDAGGQQAASVQFGDAVSSVISVGIIEGPDPIPQ